MFEVCLTLSRVKPLMIDLKFWFKLFQDLSECMKVYEEEEKKSEKRNYLS